MVNHPGGLMFIPHVETNLTFFLATSKFWLVRSPLIHRYVGMIKNDCTPKLDQI